MTQPDQTYPVLPESEIRELVRRYKAGDNCAADTIILHNEGMIAKVVRRYYVTGITGDTTFDDLMQLGRMGMLRALQDFDPDNGAKFTTYAFAWIRQSISRYGKRGGMSIGMGYKAVEFRGQAGRARAKFEQDNGREPTLAELASVTGLSESRLTQLRVNVVSIELTTGDDRRSLADVLPDLDVNVEQEAGALADADYDQAIWQAVEGLPDTWQTVIKMRFRQTPATLAEVSALLGVSRERVREIEKQSFQFLKKSPNFSTLWGGGC